MYPRLEEAQRVILLEQIVQILQVMYDRISKDLKSFLDEEVSLAVTNKEKEILEMIDKQDWECFEQTFIKKDIINLISKIK